MGSPKTYLLTEAISTTSAKVVKKIYLSCNNSPQIREEHPGVKVFQKRCTWFMRAPTKLISRTLEQKLNQIPQCPQKWIVSEYTSSDFSKQNHIEMVGVLL